MGVIRSNLELILQEITKTRKDKQKLVLMSLNEQIIYKCSIEFGPGHSEAIDNPQFEGI